MCNVVHSVICAQQRSATKVTFPLVWTNTCCSHPLYRESELIDENVLGMMCLPSFTMLGFVMLSLALAYVIVCA